MGEWRLIYAKNTTEYERHRQKPKAFAKSKETFSVCISYAHIEQGLRNIYITDLILIKEILDVSYDEFFAGVSAADIMEYFSKQDE